MQNPLHINRPAAPVRGLDPVRLEEIRAKVAAGVYLSPDVADAVARIILERGDL